MKASSTNAKLIVSGLSGLLGSTLRRHAEPNFDLVNLDVTEGIDITDAERIAAIFEEHKDAAAAIHLAAFTNVSAAYEQDGQTDGPCHRINVHGSRNMAQAAAAVGMHLIHLSTDFIFDGEKTTPYTELDEPKPIEWYGATKMMAEEQVRAHAEDWTVVRMAFPYVAGPAPRADLVRWIHQGLAKGERLSLFTDQIVTPTLADDVAEGLILLVRTKPVAEIFHLTGSTSLSPYDLGLKIAEVFGFDASAIKPSLLSEFAKTDPRPRQREMRISNAKWSAHAAEHGLAKPCAIEQGLERVKKAMPS